MMQLEAKGMISLFCSTVWVPCLRSCFQFHPHPPSCSSPHYSHYVIAAVLGGWRLSRCSIIPNDHYTSDLLSILKWIGIINRRKPSDKWHSWVSLFCILTAGFLCLVSGPRWSGIISIPCVFFSKGNHWIKKPHEIDFLYLYKTLLIDKFSN